MLTTRREVSLPSSDSFEINLKGNYERSHSLGGYGYANGLAYNGRRRIRRSDIRWHEDNYGIGLSSIFHFDAVGLKNSFISVGRCISITRKV